MNKVVAESYEALPPACAERPLKASFRAPDVLPTVVAGRG